MTLVMLDKGDAYDDSVPSDTFELGLDYDIQDKNRDPTKQEIEACKDHLIELIDELQPNAIVTLGKEAVQITKLMKEQKYKIPLLKLVHPAFIARKELKYLSVKKQARKLEKFLEQL